jgi:hypothetical protein
MSMELHIILYSLEFDGGIFDQKFLDEVRSINA